MEFLRAVVGAGRRQAEADDALTAIGIHAVEYGAVARVLAAAQREGVTRLGVVDTEQYLP